ARSLEVPTRVIPMPRRGLRLWAAWWRSRRAIERESDRFQPHIVHANEVMSCPAMSKTAGMRGIPLVVHVRWPVEAAAMCWWAGGGCGRIGCVSSWLRDQLGDRVGTPLAEARVRVLFDPYTWTALAEQRPEGRHEHDLGGVEPAEVSADAGGRRELRLGF